MRIAVAGANSFIGSNIILEYVQNGQSDVYAIYHKSSDKIPKGCKCISANEIDRIGNISLDILFVSIGNHSLSSDEFSTQAIFLKKLVSTLHFKKIVYVSSVFVYGKHSDIISINSTSNEVGIYGNAKIREENIVKECNNYSIIRFTYIYGNSMNKHSLIPIWTGAALRDKKIFIYGDGKRLQDYLHISDAVKLCIKASCSVDENLLVIGASGKSISNYDLAVLIANGISKTQVNFSEIADIGDSYRFDISHTIAKLNWQPAVKLQDGIAEYVKYSCESIDL